MDPTSTDPIALAEARMRWLDARQRVLARNIANADTPGFRPSDMRPFTEALAAAGGGGMTQTNARHLAGAGGDARARRDRRLEETTPDGNAVSIDREAMRVAETETAHTLAVSLHRHYVGLFRTALGHTS